MSHVPLSPELSNVVDGVLDALERAGIDIVGSRTLPTELGARAELVNGAIVNIYNTGTVQVQGKNIDAVRLALRDYVNNPPP